MNEKAHQTNKITLLIKRSKTNLYSCEQNKVFKVRIKDQFKIPTIGKPSLII